MKPTSKTQIKAKRIKVLWNEGKGLHWRWAYRVNDDPPQATRKLALAFHKDFVR